MSTNNPTSGQAQEDVKRVPHDKQKIQGAEKNAMDHAHDDFYKNFKPDQEVVKKMKNKEDVKYKLPSEVESRFDYADLYETDFDSGFEVLDCDKIKSHFATEQVALLTRVLGLLEKEKMTMRAAIKTHSDAGAGYTIGVNSLVKKLIKKVQAIIKEYEV